MSEFLFPVLTPDQFSRHAMGTLSALVTLKVLIGDPREIPRREFPRALAVAIVATISAYWSGYSYPEIAQGFANTSEKTEELIRLDTQPDSPLGEPDIPAE